MKTFGQIHGDIGHSIYDEYRVKMSTPVDPSFTVSIYTFRE